MILEVCFLLLLVLHTRCREANRRIRPIWVSLSIAGVFNPLAKFLTSVLVFLWDAMKRAWSWCGLCIMGSYIVKYGIENETENNT